MLKRILAVLFIVIIALSSKVPASAYKTDYYGDVDRDGSITSSDALLILMHSVDLKPITDIRLRRIADVNGDGNINSDDALMVLQKVVMLIDQLPMDAMATELINSILEDYSIYSGEPFDDSLYHEQDRISDIQIEMDLLAKYENPEPRDLGSYSWFGDAGINIAKLTDRITSNSRNSGIAINKKNTKKIELIADAVIAVTDLMKEEYPDYDFGIAFENIDRLSLSVEQHPDYVLGFYSYMFDDIYIKDVVLDDEYLAKKVSRHEVSHLFQDSVFNSLDHTLNDDFSTFCRPLSCDFLVERYADSFAMKTMGLGISDDYQSEEEKLKKLCISTGKDIEYFESAIFNHNYSDLMDCFEVEDEYFGHLTMYELSIACGYSSITILSERYECYDSAMLRLFKNACIRYIKEYYKGEITADTFYTNIYYAQEEILNNCDWDYEYDTRSRLALETSVDKIIRLCHEYIY